MTPPTTYYRVKAFVFDLDGTLIDTIPLVERFWHQFATDNGLDGDKVNYIGSVSRVVDVEVDNRFSLLLMA